MNHPAQKRLTSLVGSVTPCSSTLGVHDWVRVLKPGKRVPDLLVSKQRHIYFSDRLVAGASDKILTMLIAHGMAHHEMQHLRKRSILWGIQYVGFIVGGAFVPGLGLGYVLTTPVIDAIVGTSQEGRADVKALSCLEQMGYTVDDYIEALDFMRTHEYIEKTRYLRVGQKTFASRIEMVRRLDDALRKKASIRR